MENWKMKLLEDAKLARENAYCPYSNYKVGAALVTDSEKVFSGANIENASYGLTICAERSCIFSAVSQGHLDIKAIAIVTKDGGSPCGACRQVLNEFNPEMLVITSDENFKNIREYKLSELLIDAFGPRNLVEITV